MGRALFSSIVDVIPAHAEGVFNKGAGDGDEEYGVGGVYFYSAMWSILKPLNGTKAERLVVDVVS